MKSTSSGRHKIQSQSATVSVASLKNRPSAYSSLIKALKNSQVLLAMDRDTKKSSIIRTIPCLWCDKELISEYLEGIVFLGKLSDTIVDLYARRCRERREFLHNGNLIL
jgi:hypothetical protein